MRKLLYKNCKFIMLLPFVSLSFFSNVHTLITSVFFAATILMYNLSLKQDSSFLTAIVVIAVNIISSLFLSVYYFTLFEIIFNIFITIVYSIVSLTCYSKK